MRQLFLISAKLIGLMQIFWALTQLQHVVLLVLQFVLFESGESGMGRMHWSAVYMMLQLGIGIGIAWLLIFRTAKIADRLGIQDQELTFKFKTHEALWIGAKLIGVYVIASSLPGIVIGIMGEYSTIGGTRQWSSKLVSAAPSFLSVLIGIFLAFRTNVLIRWITPDSSGKRTDANTPQQH